MNFFCNLAMPKSQPPTRRSGPRMHHHNPLAADIMQSNSTLAKVKANSGRKGKEREERREQSGKERSGIDRSILAQAKEQQKEEKM